jgi:peroxiredoxin Q/BCP
MADELGPGMPAPGKKAPAFDLPSSSGENISLAGLKGKSVVLYFYPKDDTPGCTIEAQEFRASLDKFKKKNAVVLGVSPDSVKSHCKFIGKFDLNFELLADEEHAVCEKYGVWVEKSMYGKKYMGVQRATFLIGEDGKLLKVWPKVKPEGHAEEVLAAI